MEIQHMKSVKRTAILVDGGFYRAVAYNIFGEKTPAERADELEHYCWSHIHYKYEERELYRIFYYDCLPSSKNVYHPMLKKQIDLSKSPLNIWMNEFISILKSKRKFAIRLGRLSEDRLEYTLHQNVLKNSIMETYHFRI